MCWYKKLLDLFSNNGDDINKAAKQQVDDHLGQFFRNNPDCAIDPDIDAHYDKLSHDLHALETKSDKVDHIAMLLFIMLLIAFFLSAMFVGESIVLKVIVLILGPSALGFFFYKWFRIREKILTKYKSIQAELINIEKAYAAGLYTGLDKMHKEFNIHTINHPITTKSLAFLGAVVTVFLYANLIFGIGN